MKKESKMVRELCQWFADCLPRLDTYDPLETCELLLCASDLCVESPVLHKAIQRLLEQQATKKSDVEPVLHSILVMVVFTRYNCGEDIRREFLHYWLSNDHFSSKGVFIAGTLASLALQNRKIMDSSALNRAASWYLEHDQLTSDKLAAWVPFCLNLTGFREKAREKADEALARRGRDGSWGQDVRRTIGCAYALALSGIVSEEELHNTIRYIESKYNQGVIAELPSKAQVLRFFHVLRMLSNDRLRDMRELLNRSHKVFISYSRKDMELADKLVRELEQRGYEVWIDRSGIQLGDEWPERIARGMNEADIVLMLITTQFLSSDYCSKEILYALKRKKPLLALHLDATSLPDKIDFMLGDIQRLRISDYEDFNEFLKGIENGLKNAYPIGGT